MLPTLVMNQAPSLAFVSLDRPVAFSWAAAPRTRTGHLSAAQWNATRKQVSE